MKDFHGAHLSRLAWQNFSTLKRVSVWPFFHLCLLLLLKKEKKTLFLQCTWFVVSKPLLEGKAKEWQILVSKRCFQSYCFEAAFTGKTSKVTKNNFCDFEINFHDKSWSQRDVFSLAVLKLLLLGKQVK